MSSPVDLKKIWWSQNSHSQIHCILSGLQIILPIVNSSNQVLEVPFFPLSSYTTYIWAPINLEWSWTATQAFGKFFSTRVTSFPPIELWLVNTMLHACYSLHRPYAVPPLEWLGFKEHCSVRLSSSFHIQIVPLKFESNLLLSFWWIWTICVQCFKSTIYRWRTPTI